MSRKNFLFQIQRFTLYSKKNFFLFFNYFKIFYPHLQLIILKHKITFYTYQKTLVKTIHFYIFLDGIQMVYILPELVQIHWVSMKHQYVYINLFHIVLLIVTKCFMHKSKYQTLFLRSHRVAGSIASSSQPAIFPMID
jgi:hypothetical protein